jgi:hypothetical protein
LGLRGGNPTHDPLGEVAVAALREVVDNSCINPRINVMVVVVRDFTLFGVVASASLHPRGWDADHIPESVRPLVIVVVVVVRQGVSIVGQPLLDSVASCHSCDAVGRALSGVRGHLVNVRVFSVLLDLAFGAALTPPSLLSGDGVRGHLVEHLTCPEVFDDDDPTAVFFDRQSRLCRWW